MAKSNIGKAVSRVGSSGGGKAYRKARPSNYYAVLAIITILGLSAVVFSRYERQHPASASTIWPTVNSTGYNALASQQCGTVLPDFHVERDTSGTYVIITHNVLQVAPLVASQAGNNATLGTFISQMPGFSFTKDKMTFPTATGTSTAATTYIAGTACSAGTKYAGQKGYPVIAYWPSTAATKATLTTDPASVKLTPYMLITFAFEPKGIQPLQPSAATINAMFKATPSTTTTTTSTTIPATTTTTTPGH